MSPNLTSGGRAELIIGEIREGLARIEAQA
jgi:hypothetical protein